MRFSDYTTKSTGEIFSLLQTSPGGLSGEEAEERLKTYGLNEIRAKEAGGFDIFFRQFKSPFAYLLFIAAMIAFIVGERIDGYLIVSFVLINVFIGFFQEAKAHKSVSLLKKYLPSNARVLRNGAQELIDKKFLVPGDIVLLEPGNIAPADLRALEVKNFLTDESVLSGESYPVEKISQSISKEAKEIFQAKNIIFAGTSVVSGEAKGIVVGTGKSAVLGGITGLVSGISRESVYEKSLLKFSKIILKVVVTTIILVFLANLIIKGRVQFTDYLIFSIALVVGIIPEVLPIIVTLAFSRGALRLAKEKVVVKRLSSIEDLGNVEILCTDKTGTLTENKLHLENIYSSDKEKCLLYGLLASSYMKESMESIFNPFDLALLEKSSSANIRQSLNKFKIISELPFDSFRFRNSVLLGQENGQPILLVRGAPETILKLSSSIEGNFEREKIKNEIEAEGSSGKRTIAIAFKEIKGREISPKDEAGLAFLGYFSFSDPLKGTAKEAILAAKKLGVRIKILTGDSKEVAGYIAKEISLVENARNVISGEEIDSLSDEEMEGACQNYSVFARVSPETKYRIVKILEKSREVGFLGDGANDVPALKAANAAIAVKEAADVAREASDVVLLERDLKVVINGILEGRNIFSNINKYIKCALSSNFGNFYSMALISLFIPFLPMLPSQILLGNLLSDFPFIAIASDKVDVEELKKPKAYQLGRFIPLIFLLALTSMVFDFIFFGIFYKNQPAVVQTLWFIESILTEIALIFSIRTFRIFTKAKSPGSHLIGISLFTFFIIVILPFLGFGRRIFSFAIPPISALLVVFGLVLAYFISSEIVKLAYFRYWTKKNHAT